MIKKDEIEKKLNEFENFYRTEAKTINSNSLYSGNPGIYLFRLYYADYCKVPDDIVEEQLVHFLTNALLTPFQLATFSNGFTGFAWFLNHINEKGFVDLDTEIYENYDTLIYEAGLHYFASNNHDFMHGALGCILYLAQRSKKSNEAKNYTTTLLKKLIAISTQSENGVNWNIDNSQMNKDDFGKEITYLQLSHGLASKIVVLSICLKNGFDLVKDTLVGNIHFLLNSKDKKTGLIPHRIENGIIDVKTHSGWCRSNAGMGLAIIQAANILKNTELKQKGIDIGIRSLAYIEEINTNPTDAALCHGRAGLSQMYLRYYMYTKNTIFQKAADRWMKQTFELINTKDKAYQNTICGFKSWHGMNQCWTNDPGFLTGTAGIALAMLAHISPNAINWDEAILLS